ncbi:hypothetical protein EIN_345920 [Entamoeba invadens IP1]|uniref:Peptidase S74 domain-containing protein n=1 Tax=Entamoeba invadens IP1 TaxID=370355 RepID=L7FJH1_ENTIV|nr:hypothetical protein EIN_345920 [Entamoeba invadens IP1]ELP84006.1 hypothetical protein EIN_345920 [Entamoeba invadens IP1]|eukprot:XP_004183352.1 hypothetical protein EIN_345920 [Entamoeba invadens IP1]
MNKMIVTYKETQKRRMEQTLDNSSKVKRVRFKEYRCIYPGCKEGLKTKYNCLSHIYDMHVRALNKTVEPFKTIKDKKAATELCLPYLKFEENAVTNRKRRPYDFSDLLPHDTIKASDQDDMEIDANDGSNSDGVAQSSSPPQMIHTPPIKNEGIVECGDPLTRQLNMYTTTQPFLTDSISFTQNPINAFTQNPISLNPLTYELINSCGEDFVRVYYVNQNLRRLHVFGEVFSENGFFQRSDARYKRDIQNIDKALEKINLISGKSFKYLSDDKMRFGFIAQELKEVIPDAVRMETDGSLAIDPLSLLPYIVESIKEITAQLKDVQNKTNSVRRFISTAESTLQEIEKVKSCDENSLGPPIYCAGCGMFFGLLAVIVALQGSFPFMWGFFMVSSLCFWTSFQFAPRGKFNSKSQFGHFVILNIGVTCLALTLLIGSLLQMFLCIYSGILITIWIARIWLEKTFKWFFSVSLVASFIACLCLFVFQPTFKCDVSTPMMRSIEYPQKLEYSDWSDVKFNLTSDIPWNCFEPRFVVNGKTIKFQSGDSILSAIAKEGTVTPDIVDVTLVCSSFEYKCNEYSVEGKR